MESISTLNAKGINIDDVVLCVMNAKAPIKRAGKMLNKLERHKETYTANKQTKNDKKEETKALVISIEGITEESARNTDALRQLEMRMAISSSRIYTTRVIDACADAMKTDESKLHNVKRRVIRIMIALTGK